MIFRINSVYLEFLQKEVDLVVIIKKFEKFKEKLHSANVNGLNSIKMI